VSQGCFVTSMLRFALRIVLSIVSLFIVLMTGVIAAAGGLRSTRFLLIQPPDNTLNAVFENGQVESLTWPGEIVKQVEIYGNRLRWVNQNNELMLWENGERRVLSRTISESYAVDYRINPDSFVWVERETASDVFALQFWDGVHTRTLSSGIVAAVQFTWLSDGRLWWLEQLASGNGWQVMQWDGRKTTRLAGGLTRVYDLQFLSCGAFWFHQPEDSPNQLVIWNGEPHTLTAPIYVRAVRSQDCETFLLLSETVWSSSRDQHYVWSGGLVQLLPSPLGYLIDDRLLLAITPSDKPESQWQMNLWRDGRFWDSVSLPFGKSRPIFADPVLHNQTVIMFAIEDTYPNGDLYAWGLDSNQLQRLTTPETRSFLSGSTPFHWFGDSETGGVAWCSRDPRTHDATIYAWEPGSKTAAVIQSHAQCILRAMRDGSLVGMTRQSADFPPGFFRWDGQQSTVFATRPENLQTSLGFSDWIVWD
jgi:hypothetical protein